MQAERPHLFDKPKNVKRLLGVLYLLCVLLLAVDFVYHRHAEHPWEALWGFYGLYGFVACVSLVLIAKQLRRLLKRPERYYDE